MKKVLHLTLLLFLCVALFSYIAWQFGVDSFVLDNPETPLWVTNLVCTFLFSWNVFFMAGYVYPNFSKRTLLIPLIYAPIHYATYLLFPHSSMQTLVPVIFILAYAFPKNGIKAPIKKVCLLFLAMTTFQLLIAPVRLQGYSLWETNYSGSVWLVLSIDQIILLFVFYCIGGEKHYARKLAVYTQDLGVAENDSEDREALDALRKLQGLAKLKAVALLLAWHIVQCAVILFVCALGDRFVEGLVLVPSFIAFGMVIKNRWHSKSLIVCSTCTILMFYLTARALPSFKYSQLTEDFLVHVS